MFRLTFNTEEQAVYIKQKSFTNFYSRYMDSQIDSTSMTKEFTSRN